MTEIGSSPLHKSTSKEGTSGRRSIVSLRWWRNLCATNQTFFGEVEMIDHVTTSTSEGNWHQLELLLGRKSNPTSPSSICGEATHRERAGGLPRNRFPMFDRDELWRISDAGRM